MPRENIEMATSSVDSHSTTDDSQLNNRSMKNGVIKVFRLYWPCQNNKLYNQAYNGVVVILSKWSVLLGLVFMTGIVLIGFIVWRFVSSQYPISSVPTFNQSPPTQPIDENFNVWENVSLSNVDYEFTIISDTPRTKKEAYDLCKNNNARYYWTLITVTSYWWWFQIKSATTLVCWRQQSTGWHHTRNRRAWNMAWRCRIQTESIWRWFWQFAWLCCRFEWDKSRNRKQYLS